MGISEIEYRGRALSASDSILQVWLKLLVDEFERLEERPSWLTAIRDSWHMRATNDFGQGIFAELDEHLTDPFRRKIVRQVAERALARLRSLGDPIPASALNSLGAGSPESTFAVDLPANLFIDPAVEFVDLLDDEESDRAPIGSRGELLQALEAHEQWLTDPTRGARLVLRGARLAGADLQGIRLTRVRFVGVDLEGANLKRVEVSQSEFQEVSLEGAQTDEMLFWKAKLHKCNFNRTIGIEMKFLSTLTEDCSFDGANLDGLQVEGSSFFRTRMYATRLTSARLDWSVSGDLRGCDFSGADLRGAKFLDADLRDSIFAEATLYETGFKRTRLFGARGLPFLADRNPVLALDFSPSGDGRISGTIANLRAQLGADSGTGPWGSATIPERYRVFRVTEGAARGFALERQPDGIEVVRASELRRQNRHATLDYQIVDQRLVDEVVQELLFRVLILGLLFDELRGTVDEVEFRNAEGGASVSRLLPLAR